MVSSNPHNVSDAGKIDDRFVSRAGNTLTIRTETNSNLVANEVIEFAKTCKTCAGKINVILDIESPESTKLILIGELIRSKLETDKSLSMIDAHFIDNPLQPLMRVFVFQRVI